MKKKFQPGVYIPPGVFVGELILWKGYRWRVQAFSADGGEVTLTDTAGNPQRGEFTQATIVLECAGKTRGHEKREAAAAKKPLTLKRDGFRPVPVLVQEKSNLVIATPRIITPDEAKLVITR